MLQPITTKGCISLLLKNKPLIYFEQIENLSSISILQDCIIKKLLNFRTKQRILITIIGIVYLQQKDYV